MLQNPQPSFYIAISGMNHPKIRAAVDRFTADSYDAPFSRLERSALGGNIQYALRAPSSIGPLYAVFTRPDGERVVHLTHTPWDPGTQDIPPQLDMVLKLSFQGGPL